MKWILKNLSMTDEGFITEAKLRRSRSVAVWRRNSVKAWDSRLWRRALVAVRDRFALFFEKLFFLSTAPLPQKILRLFWGAP